MQATDTILDIRPVLANLSEVSVRLVTVQQNYVKARHALALQEGQRKYTKAMAELEIITVQAGADPKGLGTNDKERERNLEIFLGGHEAYQVNLKGLNDAQLACWQAETALDIVRREWEYLVLCMTALNNKLI